MTLKKRRKKINPEGNKDQQGELKLKKRGNKLTTKETPEDIIAQKKAIFASIQCSDLTPKEKLFIHEYFKCFSPYEAYKLVGFDGDTDECDKLFFSDRIQAGIKSFLTMPSVDMETSVFTNLGITEELVTKIEHNAALGLSIEKIAKLVGVPLGTFKTWMDKGQELEKQGEIDSPHYKLTYRFKKARIEGEKKRIETILNVGYGGDEIQEIKRVIKPNGNVEETIVTKRTPKNWQALAWALERQYPEVYGKQEKLKIESFNEMAQKIKDEVNILDDSVPAEPISLAKKRREKSKVL